VAHWTEVERIAMSLPEMTSHTGRNGIRQWKVRDKPVAWERPLRESDHEALGDSAPDGPILGVRTPDTVAKEALIASEPAVYFTTPHFNGYPAVLVQLERISLDQLEDAIVEAWLVQAPKRVTKEWLDQRRTD